MHTCLYTQTHMYTHTHICADAHKNKHTHTDTYRQKDACSHPIAMNVKASNNRLGGLMGFMALLREVIVPVSSASNIRPST